MNQPILEPAGEFSAVATAAVTLSLRARVAAHARAFPKVAESLFIATIETDDGPREWLYGHISPGQDYRNLTRYYGAYPRTYLDRLGALFPDMAPADTLHAFSGSLPPGDYTRIDINPALAPDIVGSVYDLPQLTDRRFRLVYADPPYTAVDAERYGTPGVNRRLAMAAFAQVVPAGGHVVWLDTHLPMFRKDQWDYYGAIALCRSTNQRVRQVSLFERTAAA